MTPDSPHPRRDYDHDANKDFQHLVPDLAATMSERTAEGAAPHGKQSRSSGDYPPEAAARYAAMRPARMSLAISRSGRGGRGIRAVKRLRHKPIRPIRQ